MARVCVSSSASVDRYFVSSASFIIEIFDVFGDVVDIIRLCFLPFFTQRSNTNASKSSSKTTLFSLSRERSAAIIALLLVLVLVTSRNNDDDDEAAVVVSIWSLCACDVVPFGVVKSVVLFSCVDFFKNIFVMREKKEGTFFE